MHKILIVEDDKHILTGIVDSLTMEGYKAVTASDGKAAIEIIKSKEPDLIILDVMLPKLNGFEICKYVRERGIAIPIIILSARAEEQDKVMGLELGADDYMTKPFSPRELLVRVKAVLRRAGTKSELGDTFEVDGFTIDFKKFMITKQGKEQPLTVAEQKVLKILIANKDEPVSRHKILSEIWTAEDVTTRTVDTHIWNLREKLEKNPSKPKHILTVHRIGYKWVD